jgi:hypothetical protein
LSFDSTSSSSSKISVFSLMRFATSAAFAFFSDTFPIVSSSSTNISAALMSIGDGSTGTMMVSARLTSSASSLPDVRAGESITRYSVLRGTPLSPSSNPAIPVIGGYSAGRAASQPNAEPCGS